MRTDQWPFWAGFAGILILWALWWRHIRWARFITTIEHESLHAIVGMLTLIPVRELKVREDGSGHVLFEPPGHWLLYLAPYFIPLLLLIEIGLTGSHGASRMGGTRIARRPTGTVIGRTLAANPSEANRFPPRRKGLYHCVFAHSIPARLWSCVHHASRWTIGGHPQFLEALGEKVYSMMHNGHGYHLHHWWNRLSPAVIPSGKQSRPCQIDGACSTG